MGSYEIANTITEGDRKIDTFFSKLAEAIGDADSSTAPDIPSEQK